MLAMAELTWILEKSGHALFSYVHWLNLAHKEIGWPQNPALVEVGTGPRY